MWKTAWTFGITMVLGLLSAAIANAAAPSPPTEDLMAGPSQGPWRRLFLDSLVVEDHQGLHRIFHSAKKYEGNPILRPDKPWEGMATKGGPHLYGTVMWDEGKLRMWYLCQRGNGKWINCYAESTDGIHWTKPNLGIFEFEGSKDNNIWDMGSQDVKDQRLETREQVHIASIIKRPWEADPNKRYVLYCRSPRLVNKVDNRAAFSPDGLRWTFDPETDRKGLFDSNDVQNYFYDPYKKRYAATWKAVSRRGRSVGIAFSADGLKWTKPVEEPVMVADDLDPNAAQIYGMPVFPYQGMYIGQAWIYHARWFTGAYSAEKMHEAESDSPCTLSPQLAWSWDLVNWTRTPDRNDFIALGKDGEFDDGIIWTARAPVQVGDQLHFYYGAVDGRHDRFYQSKLNLGLAILRLDGFCSMQARANEGWLVSRREQFTTPQVTINAKTLQGGYVVAEILDKSNKPLPGFTRADCVAFTGDSTRHVLRWKNDKLPDSAREIDKKVRFYLKNADLYSYFVQ